jgi:hypothetical protein
VPDAPGPAALTVNFDLVRGIPLRGRVTDLLTHKPPQAAAVEYYPLFPNRHSSRITNLPSLAASSAVTGPDGSYTLVVLPGPGVVCVAASPRNSYAVAAVDDEELAGLFNGEAPPRGGNGLPTAGGPAGQGGVCVNKYNVVSLINPNEQAESLTHDLRLQPARALPGTVVDPDGKPLAGVTVTGLAAMPHDEVLESASFRVTGLNPRCTRELFFHHREKGLGKLLTVRGDQAEALTVRLDVWGSVSGRVVDKRGKSLPGVLLFLRNGTRDTIAKTDRDGRFRASVAPGQKYSLRPGGSRRLLRQVADFEVELGHSHDLGDLPLGD